MPVTPDRTPGPSLEEELRLTDEGADPTVVGSIVNNGGDILAMDATGIFNLRSGSGLTDTAHKALDQLVHAIAETCYQEVTRASGQITDIVYWTDNGKTQKIRETSVTRSSGKVSSIVTKQYDGAGALVATLTGTVTRSSGKVSSIDWALT